MRQNSVVGLGAPSAEVLHVPSSMQLILPDDVDLLDRSVAPSSDVRKII